MMNHRAVSIPGKLFVLGEYAVLAGGPALLTTAAPRIHIHPRESGDGYRILGPTFSDPLRLPQIVARILHQDEYVATSIEHLTVDLREFYAPDGTKLGIGSSAASTVALIQALAPHLSPLRRFELAFKAHRELQNGSGSGADIAASTFGGTIAYSIRNRPDPFHDLLDRTPGSDTDIHTAAASIETGLTFPADLTLHAVWTGAPAHSTSFITGVKVALQNQRPAIQQIFNDIAHNARSGIEALRQNAPQYFLTILREGDLLMERLGALCDLPIITDTHRHLRQLATKANLIAKPSGAGGGDFTLLAGPSDQPLPPSIKENYLVLTL